MYDPARIDEPRREMSFWAKLAFHFGFGVIEQVTVDYRPGEQLHQQWFILKGTMYLMREWVERV